MPRGKKEIGAALLYKGFDRAGGDHRYFVHTSRSGLKTRVRTKTSHSPKVRDIADNLLGQMARQCLPTRQDLLRLGDCPMDRDSYESLLVEQGEL